MQTPTVSVIVLNYRDADLTLQCIASVMSASVRTGDELEIIVVDNSASDTLEILRNALPERIVTIANENNVGFARACNQGIDIARAPLILLLNNDAFLNAECLALAISFLQTNPTAGILSPQLVGVDGVEQVTGTRFPSIKHLAGEYLLPFPYLGSTYSISSNKPFPVDTVIGAAMFIRREVIDCIGKFDEGFFFTGEDIDYCRRTRDAGFVVYLDPRCKLVHLGGSSQQNQHWAKSPYLHKARIHYFYKHYGWVGGVTASLIIRVGLLLRSLKSLLGQWIHLR